MYIGTSMSMYLARNLSQRAFLLIGNQEISMVCNRYWWLDFQVMPVTYNGSTVLSMASSFCFKQNDEKRQGKSETGRGIEVKLKIPSWSPW